MIALSESLIRSVKVGSSALDYDDLDDEAALTSEQSRSHAVIESMLASSPPQPSSTSTLLVQVSEMRSVKSSSTGNLATLPSQPALELVPKSPSLTIRQSPDTDPSADADNGSRNPGAPIVTRARSGRVKLRDDDSTAAQPPPPQSNLTAGLLAKNVPTHGNNLLPVAPKRPVHPRSQSANQPYHATASTSTHKHSSTLSDDAFSKEAVIVTPVSGKSSLSRELSDSGIIRTTRPYSSSANSSPRHGSDSRTISHSRDRSEMTFTSTGTIVPNIHPVSHNRQRSRGRSATVTSLSVFPGVDRTPLSLAVPLPCPVHRVIEMIIAQYKEERIQPPLKHEVSDAYELRVLDDDDGTPDDDMPPLDRDRDVHEYGVDAVAFVEVADYQPKSPALRASSIQQQRDHQSQQNPQLTRVGSVGSMSGITGSRWDDLSSPKSGFPSPQSSLPPTPHSISRTAGVTKVTVKVILADMETHLLTVSADTRLEDLLPLISRRKSSQLQPEHWKFIYHHEHTDTHPQLLYQAIEIDPKTPLNQLSKYELRLLNKLDTPRRPLIAQQPSLSSSVATAPHPDQFVLTLDSASAYSEYRVIKTNERGKKQHRMFGIDRHKVYNKHVSHTLHRRRISFEVTRAYRTIRSIASIHTDSATKFSIVYHEKGGKLTERQYETETKMECAEIVAKLRFLVNLARTNTSVGGEAKDEQLDSH